VCVCDDTFLASQLVLQAFLCYGAVNEEKMQCISKHAKDATSLRGDYKFKNAEVGTIMIAAGFAEQVSGKDFHWEYLFVPGRQLATAENIKDLPGGADMWTYFCNTTFPGLLKFKAVVDTRGSYNLSDNELDCRSLAYVDWHLCETLLTDAAFHYYDHPGSDLWQELEAFSDPTTQFMQWFTQVLAPWVQQLQRDAERAWIHISKKGRAPLDSARDALGIAKASTSEHSRAILAEMIRQLDAGTDQAPIAPPTMPAAPVVRVPTISLSLEVAGARNLYTLWTVWDKSLKQYYSPRISNKPEPPRWIDGTDKSGKRFAARKHMLFELDAQVAFTHTHITKTKDRTKAVQHVLDAWKIKMDQYSFTDKDGTSHCIKLLPTQVGLCFQQAVGQKKNEVQLKVGKSVNNIRQGDLFGNAKDFLSVFQ